MEVRSRRSSTRRISLVLGLCVVLVLFAWPVWNYSRLPCHKPELGYWRPLPTDFEHFKISWGFHLNKRGGAAGFAACLRSNGYIVYHNNFGDGDSYLASKGKERIANTDGFGHIDPDHFFVW